MVDHVKEYVHTRIVSVKLTAAEKSSKVLANLVAGFVVEGVFLFFFVFASFAAAYALSAWIGKMYAGFLVVAGIYLLFGMIVWMGRERILRLPIMNGLSRQLFKTWEGDEED